MNPTGSDSKARRSCRCRPASSIPTAGYLRSRARIDGRIEATMVSGLTSGAVAAVTDTARRRLTRRMVL